VKRILALGLVVALGYVGFRLADPLYDAAARSICSGYAADEGLVLVDARGSATGRRAFRSFPDYSCMFLDAQGGTVFVDENDGLIATSWTYRALRVAGWLAWVVGVAAGVGLAATFGLLSRD
jgi:hypothetical protein